MLTRSFIGAPNQADSDCQNNSSGADFLLEASAREKIRFNKKVNYAFKHITLVHPVKTQKISQINLLYGGNKMKRHKQTSQQIQDKRSLVWLEIFQTIG